MNTLVRCGLACAVCLLVCSEAAAQQQQEPATREQKLAAMLAARDEALAVLKQSSDFLGRQPRFRFAADVGYETLQPSGVKIEFGAHRVYTVRRPDRARIDVTDRDGTRRELRFDGRHFTSFHPDQNAYASVEKPGSLDELIDYLERDLGVPLPLSDFLHGDFYTDVHENMELGVLLGPATIDGRPCDQLVLVGPNADIQLWIEQGATPLPRRVVMTYRDAPGRPYFQARLFDWDLAPDTGDELFTFSPPEGAERLPVRPTGTQGAE